jgi:large subunit ribosomal protein L35
MVNSAGSHAGLEDGNMPKQKTHKASKKRFRVSATGKLKRSQAGKKHLNSPKSGKRKRQLRKKITETGVVAKKYAAHIGG